MTVALSLGTRIREHDCGRHRVDAGCGSPDPDNWETHYGLAVARAASGLDPRPLLRLAVHMRSRDPRETPSEDLVALHALRDMESDDPSVWRQRAPRALVPVGAPPRLLLSRPGIGGDF